MVVRTHKLLFWQYIEWTKIAQYIDSLKSRKYQEFLKRSYKEKSQLYKSFVISPIEILIALRNISKELSLNFCEFEVGYILFCFSKIIILDVSFFFIIGIRIF